jgi:choline dehydrogenase-like flavoprotein
VRESRTEEGAPRRARPDPVASGLGGFAPGGPTSLLRPEERRTLRAVCDALAPAAFLTAPAQGESTPAASDLGVDRWIEAALASVMSFREAKAFRRLLRSLDDRLANLLLSGRPVRFRSLTSAGQTKYLQQWRDSRLASKRSGFQSLKRLVGFLYYAVPGPEGVNPSWAALGYPGEVPAASPSGSDGLSVSSIEPDRPLSLEAEVCVIGSGAGGSVVASELGQAGIDVVLVEAGEQPEPGSLVPNELAMTQRLYDAAGLFATRDLSVQLLGARCAGGGTFVNWMTCLRPPAPVLREWEGEHGIRGLTGPEFAQDVDEVWRALGVNDQESQRNPNNEVIWRGCRALGYRYGLDYDTIARNAVGCRARCDFCGFGCRFGCKRSTPLNYLARARASGVRMLFRTEAVRLESSGSRVTGVQAVHRSSRGASFPVQIRARAIVAAGGAVQTPALLLRSGFRTRGVGRSLRLHPTTAVSGEFAHDIRPWAGPPQTVVVRRFLDLEGSGTGFWIEAAPAHPGLFAMSLPWTNGLEHHRWMRERYRRSSATIVLLRDPGAGTVRIDREGRPLVDYALTASGRALMIRGIQETGRILAAAGARSLGTLHADRVEVRAMGETWTNAELTAFFDAVSARSLGSNRILLFSAHFTGSCPMGAEARKAPVDPSGALRDAEGLFVADGSVFPSAPAVNPMITIMAMARRAARSILAYLRPRA